MLRRPLKECVFVVSSTLGGLGQEAFERSVLDTLPVSSRAVPERCLRIAPAGHSLSPPSSRGRTQFSASVAVPRPEQLIILSPWFTLDGHGETVFPLVLDAVNGTARAVERSFPTGPFPLVCLYLPKPFGELMLWTIGLMHKLKVASPYDVQISCEAVMSHLNAAPSSSPSSGDPLGQILVPGSYAPELLIPRSRLRSSTA